MLPEIVFLSLLILTNGAISGVVAQPCVPNAVGNIGVSPEGVVSWSASGNNCPDTYYLLRISRGDVVQQEYNLNNLSMNVTFLGFCIYYNFSVTPVSGNFIGTEASLETIVPLPNGADIPILYFATSLEYVSALYFDWTVEDKYKSCVDFYEVFMWHEDSITPSEWYFYEGNSYHIFGVPACMKYRFDITAVYYQINGTTATFNYTVPERPNAPSLQYVLQDALTINTTWVLESFSDNRCKVTSLHVTSSYFNTTIPIEDTRERPNVEVNMTGLKADSMYYFNITIENQAGISDPFQIAVQTLPIESSLETDFREYR